MANIARLPRDDGELCKNMKKMEKTLIGCACVGQTAVGYPQHSNILDLPVQIVTMICRSVMNILHHL
jgi:hypothetical protein